MAKGLTLVLLALAAVSTGCAHCEPQCEDYLRVIPEASLDAGAWPPTNTYRFEIVLDGDRFECDGYFESEGEDVWTCSKGIAAHSRFGWRTPTFVIDRSRDEVGDVETVHVKLWREDVLIFDEDVDIWWELVNADSTFEPPCGCWAGIIQANIENFEMLEEGS